ncbi:MAG: MarR family transcriptional regulator [Actinomycetota bacterium]
MGSDRDLHRDLYQAIRLVRPLHLNVHRFVEHLLVGGELTVSTRAVLEAIIELEPATTAELSRHLALRRQQVERTVGPLAEQGLIVATPDRTDRRLRRWTATDRGREVFTSVHQMEIATVIDMCRDVDPADIAVTARVLATIDERFRTAVYGFDDGLDGLDGRIDDRSAGR